jgi:8-oxo-dGTP pyrophosphatase MutT (NUDIX family)
MPKPWKLISSKREESYRIFNLRIDRARSPRTRRIHEFYVLESRDWVNVIPLTPANEVVLVRQYRHGTREVTLEIPGGLVEGNDSPEQAACRELREETGYVAREMVSLGAVDPNPAFLNNRCYTYLARDVALMGDQQQDEKEDIEVVLRPVHELHRLIQEGDIAHSLVVAAFYRFFWEYLPLEARGNL